jgi:NADPH:quinone reductase-like Zn-dependent oxidoreductase
MRSVTGIKFPKDTILGTEFAGQIETVGKDVTQFKEGDEVFGYIGMRGGAYAEYICFPQDGVLATKPVNMTYEQAAAIQQGGLTALYLLRKIKIQKGQKILIYGASGGVGLSTVQIAKHFGAKVTGVCSTTKVELVKSMGADKVIDYTTTDYTQTGETYDVIFDTIGTSPFSGSVKSLKDDGIYLFVTYGLRRTLRARWLSLTNSRKAVSWLVEETREDLIAIRDLIETGKLKVVIDKTFPLEKAAEAHAYAESGQKIGHIVITPFDA